MDARRVLEDPRFGRVTIEPGRTWTIDAAGGTLRYAYRGGVVTGDGDGRAWHGGEWLRRHSQDAHAEIGARRYRLRHTGARSAELERDGTIVARLTGPGRGSRPSVTRRPHDYDAIDWRDAADAADARAGHLLASRFGAGVHGAARRIAGGLLDVAAGAG